MKWFLCLLSLISIVMLSVGTVDAGVFHRERSVERTVTVTTTAVLPAVPQVCGPAVNVPTPTVCGPVNVDAPPMNVVDKVRGRRLVKAVAKPLKIVRKVLPPYRGK